MSTNLSLPFNFNSGGGTDVTVNERKMYSDRVVATLLTPIGSRVQRPTFGSELPNIVMENETEAIKRATDTVRSSFALFLSALTLLDVSARIDTTDKNNAYLVLTIDYELPTKAKDQVTLKVGTFTRSGDVIQEIA
jgi:phage baseplate assembly protein W